MVFTIIGCTHSHTKDDRKVDTWSRGEAFHKITEHVLTIGHKNSDAINLVPSLQHCVLRRGREPTSS